MSIGWDLAGRVALVSGGTRGIGGAISRALLAAGAEVIALYRENEAAARRLRQDVGPPQAARLRTIALDVGDPGAVKALFDDWAGPLDLLVNNAGVRQDALLGMMSEQAWREVLRVNLDGVFHLCKHAVRRMIAQRRGRIVNISSPAAVNGVAGLGNYAASKAGVVALTRTLARELAGRGITVNCVMPGFVETELIADLSDKRRRQMLAEVPLGRFARPEEIACAVLFCASDEAGYLTGATLPVTGGIVGT